MQCGVCGKFAERHTEAGNTLAALGRLLLLMMLVSGGTAKAQLPRSTSPAGPVLRGSVEAYFRADQSTDRVRLARVIQRAARGDVRVVIDALGDLKLWSPLASGEGKINIGGTPEGPLTVAYRLPKGYDPDQPYPALLVFSENGVAPAKTLEQTEEALGELIRGFVLLCPEHQLGGTFHDPAFKGARFRQFMYGVRRRIHVDTDRVFLWGHGRGGDAAWTTAIMHADLLAGAIMVSSYPVVPYARQVYPLLLENLRQVPVLRVWPSASHASITARQRAVAIHNQAIVTYADQAGLDIQGVEVARQPSDSLGLPLDEVARLLARRRVADSGMVAHWFRYPAQGGAAWLRQAKPGGQVWEADQLAILPSAVVDRDTFIADVVKSKLAFLGGSIDGQAVTVEARNCARFDLLLGPKAVDWSEPVTVHCNGQRRHQGLVEPSIRTLLEEAYATWDFQRLVVARLSFSISVDDS